jgi:hypothetical protein
MSEKRFARFDVRPLEKPTKTESGFLKVPVFATRSGVFKYVKADGTIVREFRPPGNVFDENSMVTLAGVPVTNRHPAEMVDSKNAKKFMVGFTSDNVEKHGNMIKTSVTISDQAMIDEIEKGGLREVSCGYSCDLDFTPGRTDEGEEYDAIQSNIIYNHLAVVDRGRAGRDVRLRMDANSAILDNENNEPFDNNGPQPKQGGNMGTAKIKLNGAEYEVDAGVASAMKSALKEAKDQGMAEMKEKMSKDMEKKKDEFDAQLDTVQEKLDAAEKELKEAQGQKLDHAQIQELVVARQRVMDTAQTVLKDAEKLDEMSDFEIKKAVIVEVTNLDAEDEKLTKETYVDARFDAIVETVEAEKADGNDKLKEALGKKAGKKDSDEIDAEKVRIEKMKKDSEAWKQPLGSNKTH